MAAAGPVEEQYTRYSYPEPADDIPTWLRSYNYDPYDPGICGPLYWPEGRPRTELRILVAGCGTMQAAVLAFLNPECLVTGIDFSQASIAHEERLRARHNLTNLELRKADLTEVASLGRQFDLIVCSGVLHHLSDPDQGLRALAAVLEPTHGALLLMLYGRLLAAAFTRCRTHSGRCGFRRRRRACRWFAPRSDACRRIIRAGGISRTRPR